MYRSVQIWIYSTSLCLILMFFAGAVGGITTVATKTDFACVAECMCLSKTQILCNTGGLKGIPSKLPDNLEELSLSKNNYPVVRSDAFSHLRSLKRLNLDANNIQEIQRFAFRGLNKLLVLQIQQNPLSYIGEFAFAALQNVSTLILAHNKIGYIKGRAFAGSTQIQNIMLNNNPLKVIHSNAFSGLTYVQNLILPITITSIEPDAFNGLEHVGFLKMTYMDLKGLMPFTFRGLRYVHRLLIQTSDLGVVHRNAFAGLEHVNNLDVVSNKIDAIDQFRLCANSSIVTFRFHKNHVLRAPDYGDAVFRVNSSSIEGNHFPCDCQIHLVLESDFVQGASVNEFRRRNYCISTEFNGKSMDAVPLESIATCHDRLTKDNYGLATSPRSRDLALVISCLALYVLNALSLSCNDLPSTSSYL
ncbi:chondroadherin-like [Trichogramma pretiosum]|uniref:chondroadherin-like n=1 Tax=Trichogramma pretiosum TaxID=7493 RepID=UPI0006C99487|nr:chondroadherin-like [Trichogramma pretiosum]